MVVALSGYGSGNGDIRWENLTVDPTERVGPKTLTTVMAEASSGDEIVLMPGSYPGSQLTAASP